MSFLTKRVLCLPIVCMIAPCTIASGVVLAESTGATAPSYSAPKLTGDFALLDQNGVFHQLSRSRPKKAVVLMSYDASCASSQQAVAGFDQVRKSIESKDIEFVLMNSKLPQDRNAIRDAALKSKIDFPILMDHAQLVAESLGIKASGFRSRQRAAHQSSASAIVG
jgi:peroxiredoxin